MFQKDLMLGKTVLVAGATSGIGKSVAHACATLGASIYAIGRSEARLKDTMIGLPCQHETQRHHIVSGDLSTFEGAVCAFKEVQDESEGVDSVFYSAGVEVIKATRSLKSSDIEQTCGASFLGAMGAAKVCASKKFWRNYGAENSGGTLVFMSSVSAKRGQLGMASYAAARAGVIGFARSLAVEMFGLNVRVNTIVSGAVETEMHSRITLNLSNEAKEKYELSHPLGISQPSDIANMFIFLTSDAGRRITGTELVVDGGYLV